MVKVVRFGLLACGVALLVMLVVEIGPAAVEASFAQLSWRLLVIVWFPFVLINVADTLGWRYAFGSDHPPFGALLGARLAGEAFNVATPTASVGGEAVKAWLLRPYVAYSEGLSSVIVAKTTITIAQGLFLLVGVAVAAHTVLHDSRLLRAMQWVLAVEALAVAGFVVVQIGGAFGRAAQMLARRGVTVADHRLAGFARLDSGLRNFYRNRPWRLLLSIAFHFVGWALSAAETYLILRWLGAPLPMATAVVIEAFSTGIRFATFFLPASLGVLEGGHVAVFIAMGLGGGLGLSFSLVRRVREAAWVAVGLALFAAIRPEAAAPARA